MATGLDNLWIYTLAEELEIRVYEITKQFPRHEFNKSVDQLRRSSASVPNNIAESYHKKTNKEKTHYLHIALGEAEETKRNLHRSVRKGFIDQNACGKLEDQYTTLLKGVHAFIRFLEVGKREKPETVTKN